MQSRDTASSRGEFWLVAKTHLAEYLNKPLLNMGFILSLAIATSTLLCILVLNHASKQQYQEANSRLKSPITFSVVAKENATIAIDDFVRLRELGFHQLSATHVFEQTLANGKKVSFRAIDLLPMVLIQSENFTSKKVNLSRSYAISLGLIAAESDSTQASISLASGEKIEAHLNNVEDWGQVALLDIALAWQLFDDVQGLSHIVSAPMSTTEKTRLAASLPEHLTIQENWSLEEREGFADALHLNLSALAILGFIVSLFIAYQAANQAWTKRAELAAQLRLLGISLTTIKQVMICESLLLTLFASSIGIGISVILVSALLPLLGLTLQQIYQLTTSGHFQWQWLYSVWAFLISAVAVLIALVKQFNTIASTKVALSARAYNRPFSFKLTLVISGIFAAAFIFWPDTSWHHLMLKYGLLLMASVVLLPNLLRYLLKGLAFVSGSFRLKFIFQDASQQVGRRFLPIAAFYLALTSSIAAALMVNSFQSSFVAYLDQLLNSDMFVSYSDEQKAKITDWLPQQPEVAEFNHFQRTVAKLDSDTVNVYSVTAKRQQDSLLLKHALQAVHGKFESPCYINEQLSYRRSIAVKDSLTISHGDQTFTCQVIGVFYDYGSHGFSLKLPQLQDIERLNGWQEIGYGIIFKTGMSFEAQTMIEQLSLDKEQVFQPGHIKKMALEVFDQTFVLTQAIAFVLLSIACFGLFLSANSLELARKADLYVLSSLGYSRNELFSHMLWQWLLLACGAILISWPVAFVLANALVSLVLPASFGWSMPLVFDIHSFAASSLIGLVILIPALAIPLVKINVRASLS